MSQSRLVKYVSAKQRRANRRNAQRSTGPRTDQGKRTVARNALAHGIFFKDLLMPGENQAELDEFVTLLLGDLDPHGPTETSICEQYVEARWRMRRLRAAEHNAHDAMATHLEACEGGPFPQLRQRLDELPRLESLRPGDPDPRPRDDPDARQRLREQRYLDRAALVPVAATIAYSVTQGDGAFDRLARYQRQLELSADRALRQLHKLRKERRETEDAPDDSALLQDDNDPLETEHQTPDLRRGGVASATPASPAPPPPPRQHDVQNKPISGATPAGSDDADGYDARSCNIHILSPTKLAPRDAQVVRDDPPEVPDRTSRSSD